MMKRIFIAILIYQALVFTATAQNPKLDSVQNLLQKHTSQDTVRVNLLNQTAFQLRNIDPDKTLQYAQEAGELAGKLGFKKGKANSLHNIGLYYFVKSDYPKALEYYQKSLQLREEIGDKERISASLNNIGILYDAQGDYPKALEYYQKSLKISEDLDDKKGMANSLNNIGIIYANQGDYPQALQYHQKSLQLREEISDKNGISLSLNNIGFIYYKQGNYPKSLKYHQKSLQLKEEIGEKKGISSSLNNIGVIYYEQGDYPQALEYHQKALKMVEELGDKSGICSNYLFFGAVYLKTNQYAQALAYSLKAFELAKELGLLDELKDINKQLSDIYVATNNYQKAYEYHVAYKQLSDSTFNEVNVKKITGLEYQYKYEKEKQALILEQAKKDALKAEEVKRQKIVLNSFIVGFVFILILTLLIYRNFLIKKRANHLLQKQKDEIQQANKELEALSLKTAQQAENIFSLNHLLKKDLDTASKDILTKNQKLEEYAFYNSHITRAPLARILGLISIIDTNQVNTETTFMLEELVKSSEELDRVIRLMNEILAETKTID